MRTNKITGIVLHKTPLNEKDYIVTLYTKEFGKTQGVAKGSRRIKSKFTGHFESTHICKFEFYKSRSNFIITECNLCKKFPVFRNDLKKANIAMDIIKIVKKHTYEQTNEEENKTLYDLIENSFIELESTKAPVYLFLGFIIKFLILQGLIPIATHNYWKDVSEKTKDLVDYFTKNPLSMVPEKVISRNEFHTVMRNLEYFMEY